MSAQTYALTVKVDFRQPYLKKKQAGFENKKRTLNMIHRVISRLNARLAVPLQISFKPLCQQLCQA